MMDHEMRTEMPSSREPLRRSWPSMEIWAILLSGICFPLLLFFGLTEFFVESALTTVVVVIPIPAVYLMVFAAFRAGLRGGWTQTAAIFIATASVLPTIGSGFLLTHWRGMGDYGAVYLALAAVSLVSELLMVVAASLLWRKPMKITGAVVAGLALSLVFFWLLDRVGFWWLRHLSIG